MFFNTEIKSENSPSLERWANTCFTPVRYLFHGRTIEIFMQQVAQDRPSFPNRSWLKAALAIVALVPGLLIGTIAKIFPYYFASAHLNYQIVKKYDQNPEAMKRLYENPDLLPTLNPEDIIPFTDSHKQLEFWRNALVKKMTQKEVWTNSKFISKVSIFMEAAYKDILLLFHQLEAKHGPDRHNMAKRLIAYAHDVSVEERKADPTIYLYSYFYNSITEMYHLARGCTYVGNDGFFEFNKKLTEEEQKPYFDPQQPQYRWFKLYNSFCQLLDKYELRDKITDRRFANWSKPDEGFVEYYGFPATRPGS